MSGRKTFRKVASHRVVDEDGNVWFQAVVSLEKGHVVSVEHFEDELPMTEWLCGTIALRHDEKGGYSAWWNKIRLE